MEEATAAERQTLKGPVEVLEQYRTSHESAKEAKGMHCAAQEETSRETLEREYVNEAYKTPTITREPSGTTRTAYFFGEDCSPCTKPIAELKPINLDDLTIETHYRGRVLLATILSQPIQEACIHAAVQDDRGDVGRVAVYNLLPTAAADCVLPKGARIAIREPYCTLHHDERTIIRVDHPSDLVLLSPCSHGLPGGLKSGEAAIATTAAAVSLKAGGDSASKNKDWERANAYYTDALAIAKKWNDDDLARAIHTARSNARLQLGRFEYAIHDALAGMTPMPAENYNVSTKVANVLTLYRAGEAAYGMGDFAQAKHYFEQALRIHPKNTQADNGLTRANQRLDEESENHNRLDTTLRMTDESVMTPNTPLDRASFLSNTRVGPTRPVDSRRVNRLFATKDLKEGDFILIEKAFHFVNDQGKDIPLLHCYDTGHTARGSQTLLRFAVIDKLRYNPMLAAKYLEMCDVSTYNNSEGEAEGSTNHDSSNPTSNDNNNPGNDAVTPKVPDNDVVVTTNLNVANLTLPPANTATSLPSSSGKIPIPPVNTFQIQRILEQNAFDTNWPTGPANGPPTTGIWLRASFATHDCIPNAARSFLGDMLILRALRPIKAGREITTEYVTSPISKTVGERRYELIHRFGLNCFCAICLAETGAPTVDIARRKELLVQIKAFIDANELKSSGEKPSADTLRKGRKLLERMRRTYREGHEEEAVKKDVERWVEGLKDLGYVVYVPEKDDERGVVVDPSLGVGWDLAVQAFGGLASVLRGREGREQTYTQVVQVTMGLWETINTDGKGVDAVFALIE